MAPDWTGKRVAFVGALTGLPRRLAARAVSEAGGLPRRSITRSTDVLVVGRGAMRMLLDGRLEERLAAARRAGAEVLSEERFLSYLEATPATGPAMPAMDAATLAARSGLALDAIPTLSAFGLLEESGQGFGFQALVTSREVARLLDDGVPLTTLIAALATLGDETLAREFLRRRQVAARGGALVRLSGEDETELDGQRKFAFADEEGPSADDLFDDAEEAEAGGDAEAAAALYRRCIRLDPEEPSAAFNLGNLLRDRGRPEEAERCFLQAVAVDPAFVEAWYNLADLRRRSGRIGGAARALDAALAIDPAFADACFNRADVAWEAGDLATARENWRRYLDLDPASRWAAVARKRLALCAPNAGCDEA